MVEMNEPIEEWLLRPILEANMYQLESLLDGTIDLSHVAMCNEALDVRAENESRLAEAAKTRG